MAEGDPKQLSLDMHASIGCTSIANIVVREVHGVSSSVAVDDPRRRNCRIGIGSFDPPRQALPLVGQNWDMHRLAGGGCLLAVARLRKEIGVTSIGRVAQRSIR